MISPYRLRNRCRASNARRGFTLVELLLVLTLIVIVAAMAVPAFLGPIDDYRLLKSADLVRARWAKARNEAMRSGRTMMFRYQVQTGTFEIAPWQGEEDYLESSQLLGSTLGATSTINAAPSANVATATSSLGYSKTEQLAENVTFAALAAVSNTRDVRIQQAMQTQGGGAALQFSPPILFYPDGTSTTTRITLANKRQRFVIIQLRGLSGVAEVSDLLTISELPP